MAISFTGRFYSSLLLVAFTRLFYWLLLLVAFTSLFYCSLLLVALLSFYCSLLHIKWQSLILVAFTVRFYCSLNSAFTGPFYTLNDALNDNHSYCSLLLSWDISLFPRSGEVDTVNQKSKRSKNRGHPVSRNLPLAFLPQSSCSWIATSSRF